MSMTTPRVAATDPLHAEPRTWKQAMLSYSFIGVMRARGQVAARWWARCRPCLVEVNQPTGRPFHWALSVEFSIFLNNFNTCSSSSAYVRSRAPGSTITSAALSTSGCSPRYSVNSDRRRRRMRLRVTALPTFREIE